MEVQVLLTGLVIFIARVCDVSIGTVRTIVTVQGRSGLAFFLGLGEITLWLGAASAVITQVKDIPILGAFYALGYATGNYLGIRMERKIALGSMILRVITAHRGKEMADCLREKGQAVTVFTGEGFKGPVKELYIVCRRRDLPWILPLVKEKDPDAFYLTEQAGSVNKILRPVGVPATGWRAIFKKK
jgi:uncharacterized protein YebE (UPF0316 family)